MNPVQNGRKSLTALYVWRFVDAMQFCPPPFLPNGSQNTYSNVGYPTCGQPCVFNTPQQSQQPNVYPNIIGEGNIVSVSSLDGSTQLFFFPTLQWPQRSFHHNPYTGDLNNPYVNNLGAWYVRNFCNPLQPTLFPQPIQDFSRHHNPRVCASDYCLSPPVLPLRFHNDICTSTTDIHYFIPKQCNWFRKNSGCVAVQVACPMATAATACDNDQVNKPACACPPPQPCNCDVKNKQQKKIKCECFKGKSKSNSQMSIDSTRSKCKCKRKSRKQKRKKKSSSHTCECKIYPSDSENAMTNCSSKSNYSRMSVDSIRSNLCQCKEKPRKSKRYKKKSSHTCECKAWGLDKTVTTYAEQGSCCVPDKGRETQTSCSSVPVVLESTTCSCCQADAWSKPSCSRHAMTDSMVSFTRAKRMCESGSSSCTSDTELE